MQQQYGLNEGLEYSAEDVFVQKGFSFSLDSLFIQMEVKETDI